jgi:hypothetical protein
MEAAGTDLQRRRFADLQSDRQVAEWAPVIEMLAYQCFTTANMLIDAIRRRLLTAPLSDTDRNGMLIDYWITLHTMGHLLTIASSPAARPWLVEMASPILERASRWCIHPPCG